MRILLSVFVIFALPARALTVDELVAKNIAARGGAAKLAAIHSLRQTGKVILGDSGGDWHLEATYGRLQKRPGSLRTEFSMQGMTGVYAWDGKDAWKMEPFGGRRDPEHTSADEAKDFAHLADIDGPLVDWQKKGHRLEYLGIEDVDGTPAHKIRVTLKDGDTQYLFLDPDAFLVIRMIEQTKVRGVDHDSETDYGSYAQVAGVWLPMSIEQGEKGKPKSFHLTVEHADVNVAADDSAFRFPDKAVARMIEEGTGAPVSEGVHAPRPDSAAVLDSGVISGLGVRNIGSAAMSGRVSALAAYHDDGKTIVYVAAASGGVWKSPDGGTTFKPIFDKQPVQSIGALALDPSHPKTLWVGTGEAWTRNSTSIGDGIYKSVDGGATFINMGLPESERIARILVHPKNGDVVYACVPGKLWSDSAERGLYKTSDGGKSWSLILKGENLSTGCSGLTMDPKNPDVLFAGLWDFRRKGWTFRSGGPGPEAHSGSGLFRTSDGGKTWTKLVPRSGRTDEGKGLPAEPWGRVEVQIAPSNPKIVYAFIEHKDSALYRSSDGGVTWEARDKSQGMVWRPFYFARLIIDPQNPDRIFKGGFALTVSEDGGRSFANSMGSSHGDWHEVWIDPENSKHLFGGDDGGFWVSWDGGSRWWKGNNLPISQFYHVSVDAKDPYQVYGGLQDNSTWVGDSSYPGGITNQRWENLYGGDGFWAHVDPSDANYVYVEYQGGYIARVNRVTHAARDIQPKANFKEKLRLNWNAPIAISPTQKGTLYLGAQFLFRTRDRGDTWERISPDLTTNDKEKQKQEESGGITVDNSEAEMHTTIYAISESPKDAKVIWVGTDDGNLQLTRDSGKTWTNVVKNVAGLPPASWVSWVEASRFSAGTAYAAFDRHTFGDMTPWVFMTSDFGQSWKRIVAPDAGVRGYAHVIKEDLVKPSLLYLGTELGLWISIDGGARWAQFRPNNFPSVAVRDLALQPRENDLVLATHGRGIWIIDDLTPLRALGGDVLKKAAAFLPSRAVQQRMGANGGWSEGDASYSGENPHGGAVLTFYQRARHLYGPISMEILDGAGKRIDTVIVPARRGLLRVAWPMTVKAPKVPRAAQAAFNSAQGPRVVPGTYTVKLHKGADTIETKLAIALDRRAPYTVADRKQQFDAVMQAHGLFGEMSALTERIDAAKKSVGERQKAAGVGEALVKKLAALSARLDEVKKQIVATKEGGHITGEERIREHLDILYGALNQWEGRPARYQLDRIATLKRELDGARGDFESLAKKEIEPLNLELRGLKLPPIPTQQTASRDDDGESAPPTAEVFRCLLSHGADCDEAAAMRSIDRR
jgi:photosystem II stability/assembly factor-like uncharacterized protein